MDGTERHRDRLRMALLYLLCGIVKAQTKRGTDATAVEPFLLRAVDNLQFCKDFPWGRYTFDHMLEEIKHTMDHFGGTVKVGALWPIPGFCIPLELLAFEAIHKLGNSFRENVPRVDENIGKCPRMCKSRFKKGYLNGFSLAKVNEELGSTQEIDSILPIREEETSLMDEITEAEDYDDRHDIIVDSWMRCFTKGQGVRFDEMFEQDVGAREAKETEAIPTIPAAETPTVVDVMDILNSMNQDIKKIVDMVDGFDQRLTSVVNEVKEVKEVIEKSNEVEEVIEKSKDSEDGPIAEQIGCKRPPPQAEHSNLLGRKTRSKTSAIPRKA